MSSVLEQGDVVEGVVVWRRLGWHVEFASTIGGSDFL